MKTYNVGIIGVGFIGKVHAYGYLNLPLHYDPLPLQAKITHVCTSRRESAEAARALIGAEVATTNFLEITENPDIDIVHICTPNNLHKDALLSALENGKHIYCEKPLVATMEEAVEIRTALEDYEGTAQMTLQNRFFPAVMRAKQLLTAGFVGEPLEFRASYLHSGSANPEAPLKWKLSSQAGGGVIADLGSHVLDLVHYLLGDYARLTAVAKIAFEQRPSAADPSQRVQVDAEDCVMILSRMKNGAVGNLEATKLATGSEDEVRFEIHGTKGALRYNGMDAHHLEIYDLTEPASPIGGMRGWKAVDTGQRYPAPASGFPGPKFAIGWIRCHMACLANFLSDVAAGNPGDPGLAQGLYVQHLMNCCRVSAENGQWVDV